MRIANTVNDSIVDGRGLRYAVFTQGCPHRCPGCHNPETWDFDAGTRMEAEDLAQIARDNPLCRGVTFSGGEPFAQPEGFAELARILKAEGYEIASYTGYTFEQLLAGTPAQRELLGLLDVLVDGPFVLSQRSLDLVYRGSANQRILDVPESLRQGKAIPAAPRWQGEY